MSENESEKRETLAEVLAEMRNDVRDMGTYRGKRIILRMEDARVRQYCDRIEAAAKREKSEIEANALAVGGVVEAARHTPGNAAAMREALEKAKKAICHHADHICQSLSWENSNLQSNCADVLRAHRELCEAKTAINAALSAPARNCDKYGSLEQARKAWFAEEIQPRIDDVPMDHNEISFEDWLFAPAAEWKGEGDGR